MLPVRSDSRECTNVTGDEREAACLATIGSTGYASVNLIFLQQCHEFLIKGAESAK